MGTYLSTPVLDKHTEKGSDLADANTPVRWAVVDMQGWRKSMEDAHVARTDVPLPGCCVPKNGDDGGGSGGEGSGEAAAEEGGSNDNDAGAANPSHAKVFAVFDGHGGAEVARFCQIHLVPVLTSQSEWADTGSSGEEEDGENMNMNLASRVGRALISPFTPWIGSLTIRPSGGRLTSGGANVLLPMRRKTMGRRRRKRRGWRWKKRVGRLRPWM